MLNTQTERIFTEIAVVFDEKVMAEGHDIKALLPNDPGKNTYANAYHVKLHDDEIQIRIGDTITGVFLPAGNGRFMAVGGSEDMCIFRKDSIYSLQEAVQAIKVFVFGADNIIQGYREYAKQNPKYLALRKAQGKPAKWSQ